MATLASGISGSGLSYIIQVEDVRAREGRPGSNTNTNEWDPPLSHNDFERTKTRWFRWSAGRISLIQQGGASQTSGNRLRVITLFSRGSTGWSLKLVDRPIMTQDTQGWHPLTFDLHSADGSDDDMLSFIHRTGGEHTIKAEGHRPALIRDCYQYHKPAGQKKSTKRNKGFIGNLAILIGLAIMSSPSEEVSDCLQASLRPNAWRQPQQYPIAGNEHNRGYTIRVFQDRSNPNSTLANLQKLEAGEYGPFYS